MGDKEQLRQTFLAHKPFLLKLYSTENKVQELMVLSEGTREDLLCLFQVLMCIKKKSIPFKGAKKILKKLRKVHISESRLDTLDRRTIFKKLSKLTGYYKNFLFPLFEMPK